MRQFLPEKSQTKMISLLVQLYCPLEIDINTFVIDSYGMATICCVTTAHKCPFCEITGEYKRIVDSPPQESYHRETPICGV